MIFFDYRKWINLLQGWKHDHGADARIRNADRRYRLLYRGGLF